MLWGGVTVEAKTTISGSEWAKRYFKMTDYVCQIQPKQIKQNINKTIASYKKKGKKYPRKSLPDSEFKEIERRFKVDAERYSWSISSDATISGRSVARPIGCTEATEIYLYCKINNIKLSSIMTRPEHDNYNFESPFPTLQGVYGLK
jgi:hypothetical protein